MPLEQISRAPILWHWNPEIPVTFQTDASNKQFGTVICKEEHQFTLQAMSSQKHRKDLQQLRKRHDVLLEKLEKFHYFQLARKFLIQTDQKLFEVILKRSIIKSPPHFQEIIIQYLPYQFYVEFIKSNTMNVADWLSRLYTGNNHDGSDVPKSVNIITQLYPVKDHSLAQIRAETAMGNTLTMPKEVIQKGWPQTISICLPELRQYWTFLEGLLAEKGIIQKGK